MEFTSHTYTHAVDREHYSQTNANANKRTQTHCCDGTRGRFLRANAIVICALDLKRSGCIYYNLIFSEIGACTRNTYATHAPQGKIKEVARVSMRSPASSRKRTIANVCNRMHTQTWFNECKSALVFATWAILRLNAFNLKLSGCTIRLS